MKKIKIILTFLFLIGLIGGGYIFGQYRTSQAMMDNYLIGDKFKIVRTVGGVLEVSTLKKQESFGWQTSWVCPVNLCRLIPSTMSSVSGVANYTYRIALADHWVLERKSPTAYVLKVPKLEVKTPVAIDLSTIRIHSTEGLLSPSGPSQTVMQTYMQPLVNERGGSLDYIKFQKEDASKTVIEFARKWLRDGDITLPDNAIIEVVFSK